MRHLAAIAIVLLAGCASGPGRVGDLHDMGVRYITGREVWSGEVRVDRIVIVSKEGHLVVEPGTKVLFERIDWDGDGIGDCEITVEGRFTARGTAEKPILFGSAAAQPAKADWKYLHVNFAEKAEMEYVRVSHAFSGLQVHYSQATVMNSEFRHNVDGVRFSTADLTLTGSWLKQNTHGIRFEERGHPATITGNEISLNDVGIFAVTRCFGRSKISSNNIRDNLRGVKLGLEQVEDIGLEFNWWGVDPDGVRAGFMDDTIDPDLGRAIVEPLRSEPVAVQRPFEIPDDPDWHAVVAADR